MFDITRANLPPSTPARPWHPLTTNLTTRSRHVRFTSRLAGSLAAVDLAERTYRAVGELPPSDIVMIPEIIPVIPGVNKRPHAPSSTIGAPSTSATAVAPTAFVPMPVYALRAAGHAPDVERPSHGHSHSHAHAHAHVEGEAAAKASADLRAKRISAGRKDHQGHQRRSKTESAPGLGQAPGSEAASTRTTDLGR